MTQGGMRRGVVGGLVCAVVFGLVLTASQAWAGDNDLNRNTAVLRWLDKATARVETFEVAVNDHVQMQTLEITVKACKQHPPEESPESAAYLEIIEQKVNEPARRVFGGWMFASSPALSAMEHPIYDLWVLDCVDRAVVPVAPVSSVR